MVVLYRIEECSISFFLSFLCNVFLVRFTAFLSLTHSLLSPSFSLIHFSLSVSLSVSLTLSPSLPPFLPPSLHSSLTFYSPDIPLSEEVLEGVGEEVALLLDFDPAATCSAPGACPVIMTTTKIPYTAGYFRGVYMYFANFEIAAICRIKFNRKPHPRT